MLQARLGSIWLLEYWVGSWQWHQRQSTSMNLFPLWKILVGKCGRKGVYMSFFIMTAGLHLFLKWGWWFCSNQPVSYHLLNGKLGSCIWVHYF